MCDVGGVGVAYKYQGAYQHSEPNNINWHFHNKYLKAIHFPLEEENM